MPFWILGSLTLAGGGSALVKVSPTRLRARSMVVVALLIFSPIDEPGARPS